MNRECRDTVWAMYGASSVREHRTALRVPRLRARRTQTQAYELLRSLYKHEKHVQAVHVVSPYYWTAPRPIVLARALIP
ncbi:hypothetical protein EXIGLDRAFT_734313 [Exidia glandulosa HHB12029]|uniref:Uncharacterized protein n=1 Tax=Exidia glandulosa HHB12029 TaxID=1314781 RepID=A0A165B3P5_EXIGL|nr:hypothetical protein EXIGLDRAFT_734313 [Exidia glandulosa HHB12029]